MSTIYIGPGVSIDTKTNAITGTTYNNGKPVKHTPPPPPPPPKPKPQPKPPVKPTPKPTVAAPKPSTPAPKPGSSGFIGPVAAKTSPLKPLIPSLAPLTAGTSVTSAGPQAGSIQVAGGVWLNTDNTGASKLSYSDSVLKSVATANLPNVGKNNSNRKVTTTETGVIVKHVTDSAKTMKKAPKGSAAYKKAANDYYTGTAALKTLKENLQTEQTQTQSLTQSYGKDNAAPTDLQEHEKWLTAQQATIDAALAKNQPTTSAPPSKKVAGRDPDLIQPGDIVVKAAPSAGTKTVDPLKVATAFAAEDANKAADRYATTLAKKGTTVTQQEKDRQQYLDNQKTLKVLLDPQWQNIRAGQQDKNPNTADTSATKTLAKRYNNDPEIAQVAVASAITYRVDKAGSNKEALQILGKDLPVAQAANVGDLVLQDTIVTGRIQGWETDAAANVNAAYKDKGAKAASQVLVDATDPNIMGYLPPSVAANIVNRLDAHTGTESSTLQKIMDDGLSNKQVYQNLSYTTEHVASGSLVKGNQIVYDSPEIQQAVTSMGTDAARTILRGNNPSTTGVTLSPPEIAAGLHDNVNDAIGNGYGATFALETVRQMGALPSAPDAGLNHGIAPKKLTALAQDRLREGIGDGFTQYSKNVDTLLTKSAQDSEFITKPLAEYGGVLSDAQVQKAIEAARAYDIKENGGKNVKAAAQDQADLARMGLAGERLTENYVGYGDVLERTGAPSPYVQNAGSIKQQATKALNNEKVVSLVASNQAVKQRLDEQSTILAMATEGEPNSPTKLGIAARARDHIAGVGGNFLGRYLDQAKALPASERSKLAQYFIDHNADRIGHTPFVGPALHIGGAYANLALLPYMAQAGVPAGVDSLESVRGSLLYAQSAGWGFLYGTEALATAARLDSGWSKAIANRIGLPGVTAQGGNFMDRVTAWASTGTPRLNKVVAGITMVDIATDGTSALFFGLPKSDSWFSGKDASTGYKTIRTVAAGAQTYMDALWLAKAGQDFGWKWASSKLLTSRALGFAGIGVAGEAMAGPVAWTMQGIYTAANLAHYGVQVWQKNKAVDGAEAAFLQGAGIKNPEVTDKLANHNGFYGYATGAGTAQAYLAAGGASGRYVDYVNGLSTPQLQQWASATEALPLIAQRNGGSLPVKADSDPYFALPAQPYNSATIKWNAQTNTYADAVTGMTFKDGAWQAPDKSTPTLKVNSFAMDTNPRYDGPDWKGTPGEYRPSEGRLWVNNPQPADQGDVGSYINPQSATGAKNWMSAVMPTVDSRPLPSPIVTPSKETTTSKASLPAVVSTYTVKPGDTLWGIYGGRDGLDAAYANGLLPSFDPRLENGKF